MGGLKAIRAISSQWFGVFVINLNNEIYRNIFGIGILKEKKRHNFCTVGGVSETLSSTELHFISIDRALVGRKRQKVNCSVMCPLPVATHLEISA